MRISTCLILATALLLAALRLQAMDDSARKVLAIGLLLPPEEPERESLREGATLGVEMANASSAAPLKLVVRGRAGQWGSDGAAAALMVTEDGAMGLIAPPDGSASHLELQVSGRTAVPVVSLCGDSSVSRTGVPWMVRMVPQTMDEAKCLFAKSGVKRWSAIVPQGRAGREASRDLKEAARQTSGVIDSVNEATNLTRLAKQILANHPRGILVWLDMATAAKLVKSLRAAGFAGALAGPGWLRSAEFAAAAGAEAEGFIVPGIISGEEGTGECQRFSSVFRRRFGHEPTPSAVMSYDAATLLAQILRQAGNQPAHELFPIHSPCAGASGTLAFDSQGNRLMNLQLYQLQCGHFTTLAQN